MLIAGLVKTSLVDFPGYISCVLFTPGCNYNCFYCHNRSLIDGAYTTLNRHTVHEFLAKRAGQLDGVVITGGEPTLRLLCRRLQSTTAALSGNLRSCRESGRSIENNSVLIAIQRII